MALNRFRSLIDTLEYGAVRLAGKICGISLIIRYLRNPNPSLTVRMLLAFGATIGPKSTFKRGVFLDNVYGDSNSAGDFSRLRVGANCYIGEGVYFDLADDVILEDDAVAAMNFNLTVDARGEGRVGENGLLGQAVGDGAGSGYELECV